MALNWTPTVRKSALIAGAVLLHRALRPSSAAKKAKRRNHDPVHGILVVELWNIGDVILAMPFLAQLRARFPGARITLLSAPHAELLLRGTGLVDEYVETTLGLGAENERKGAVRKLAEIRRLSALLGKSDFDLAFQSRLHLREHVLLAESGAARTIGYSLGPGKSLLTDAVAVTDSDRHRVEDWMQLLESFGTKARAKAPSLNVSATESEWAARFLGERGIAPGDDFIAIHPGASKAEKRWPLERFEQVARDLTAHGYRVLPFADPAGYGISLENATGIGAARVGLREMIALLARSRLLVCNDSGPMHVAGALGVPTVAVFGPKVSRWFAPLGEGHQIVVGKGSSAGVEAVEVREVLAAVERALKLR